MKKIFLARHGQTDANNTLTFQGHIDNHLNSKGLLQANKLVNYFTNHNLPKIYTSDLIRTVETAKPTADVHDSEIVKIPALKEISFGEWEGLTYDEIKAKWPKDIETFFKKPAEVKISGGESFSEVQNRAWEAFKGIVQEYDDESDIFIVSHGGTVRTILCAVMNLDLNEMWKISIDNAGISCILQLENRCWIKNINDTNFLK